MARQLLYGPITSGPAGEQKPGEESKDEGYTGFFFQECHAAPKLLLKVDLTVDQGLCAEMLELQSALFQIMHYVTLHLFNLQT